MQRIVGLIHATVVAIEPMQKTLQKNLPQIKVLNFMDEGVLKRFQEVGNITPDAVRRLCSLVVAAQESGAELALLTCSSFSSAAVLIQKLVEVPVIAIDAAMLREAVKLGNHIGVIATIPEAIHSTRAMLEDIALEMNLAPSITARVVDHAFQALLASDLSQHNALISSAVEKIAPVSDVIVLAQASMARAVDVLPNIGVPVLSSPYFASQTIKEVLQC